MALSRKAAVQVGVAALGLALLAVVLGFIAYAHHRAQNYLAGLPARLGINIRQETDNVTYSQSYQGRTVFTVHAARQIQHADGKYTLRNVGITLYGREADRADKIRGDEFEYDQKDGVLTAVGDVFLDLAAPTGKAGSRAEGEDRVVHVKTSGLTYLQKERLATTDKEIDFAAGGMAGKAIGATYNGATGVVDLKSAVEVHGLRDGRPVELTAASALLDRASNVTRLEGARYVSGSSGSGPRGQQTLAADRAVIRSKPDGTPQHIDAEGNVSLASAVKDQAGSRLGGQRLEADLNDNGQLSKAHMAGAVRLAEDAPTQQVRGSTQDLRVAFDPAGRARQALLTGAVELQEKSASSLRTLHSGRLELALAGGGKDKTVLRAAEASGPAGAQLHMQEAVPGRDASETNIAADTLVGRFAASGNALTGLDGHGHTLLTRTARSSAGAFLHTDKSSGQELHLELRASSESGPARTELVRAEQHGDVQSERVSATKSPGAAQAVEHARAQDAVFDALSDRVLLTGGVQLTDAGSLLQAPSVTVDRASDTATATGGVKVSYLASSEKSGQNAEPVHVQAQQAVLHKASGEAEFTAPGGVVRMWQAGSVVEAPVIDLEQKTKTMTAHGLPGNTAAAVRAVLVGSTGKDGVAQPVRVQGSVMKYTDASNTVDLVGPVRVDDTDGRLLAAHAVLTLAAVSPPGSGRPEQTLGLFGSGRVERVVATGDVQVQQPGRRATGDRLVYTAASGMFLLTGTKTAPPRVVDAARGTITGAEIRFTSGEDSVVVTGGEGGRVRTETRMKQ